MYDLWLLAVTNKSYLLLLLLGAGELVVVERLGWPSQVLGSIPAI